MKASPIYPIEAMHGALTEHYYCRMVNGRMIVQRKPIRTKPPTEKQLAVRRAFAEKQRLKRNRNAMGRERVRSGIVVVS